jgi:mRNA degradation ribonuclease J1/J2
MKKKSTKYHRKTYARRKKEIKMGKLIVDGKNVFEIDEECVRRRRIPKECGIYEYLDPKEESKKEKKEGR